MAEDKSCPATGTMGVHSDEYYDDGRCIWCGAVKQDDETEEAE